MDIPARLRKRENPLVPPLRAAIGCPIEWTEVPAVASRPQLMLDLWIYWVKTAENFQTDREMRYYSRSELEESAFDEMALKSIQANSKGWRNRAVERYTDHVGFLKQIAFIGWDKYAKHRPAPGSTRQQLLIQTARPGAESVFFSECAIQRCEELLWDAISDDLLNVVTCRPTHLFVESLRELGACEGRPCNVMRIDLDYSVFQAHGHPRHLPSGEKLLGVSYASQTYSDADYQRYFYNIDVPAVEDIDAYVDFMCESAPR